MERVDFTNILHEAFTCEDPKSAKNTVKPSVFFALFGSVHIYFTCKLRIGDFGWVRVS